MGMLEGKVALITGGTRGIGRAIALKFASEGADIAFTGRGPESPVEAELEALGVRAKYYQTSIPDFGTVHSVVDAVVADFGRVDILVNNAGIVDDSLLIRMSEEQWDRVIDADLKAAFSYIHALTPLLARQRGGSVINIASVVGLHGNAGQANYAAAKAGLIGLSKSLSKELGGRGVRCNCIAPGFIATDMTSGMPSEWRENVIKGIPMRREGKAEEVAGVALFLASELSSYVSGEVICCDGGMSC